MKTKICSKCKQRFPAIPKYFYQDKRVKNYLRPFCKECEKKQNKEYRLKNREKLNRYQNIYYHKKYKEKARIYRINHKKHIKERIHRYQKSSSGVYGQIKKNNKRNNLKICLKEEFINWYDNQNKICIYCGIKESLLEILNWGHSGQKTRLTIDRKNNIIGYTLDNICLACSVCNTAKNQYITFKEMKIIGQVIKKIWQKRTKAIK